MVLSNFSKEFIINVEEFLSERGTDPQLKEEMLSGFIKFREERDNSYYRQKAGNISCSGITLYREDEIKPNGEFELIYEDGKSKNFYYSEFKKVLYNPACPDSLSLTGWVDAGLCFEGKNLAVLEDLLLNRMVKSIRILSDEERAGIRDPNQLIITAVEYDGDDGDE